MKIGVILDNEFTNDVRVVNEVNALVEAGHKVFVLCLNHGKYDSEELFNGAKVVRISISKNLKNKLKFINNTVFDFYSFWWSIKIKWFANKFKLDALHTHDLFMARSVILANKSLKLKTVLDLHENYPATLASYSWSKTFLGKLLVSPKRWERLESEFLPKFTTIILLSEQFKYELSNRYPNLEEKFYVYPNYPNVKELMTFHVDEKIIEKNNDFIIFYFGAIAVRRGIFTLLDTLKILVNKNSNYKVLLIGPVDNADKARLETFTKDPNLAKNIIHYDWKDIKHLPSYIKISDICISPLIKNDQHESGIANKVFQYMLFKRPLIVSNCTPQQKVVEKEKCGLVFTSEDENDLAEKIESLYNNPDLRKEMGENGSKAVLEKYNLEISKQNLISMYKTLETLK
jgi:glycosyltransferase involved in cell wall biosynthesis